MECYLDLILGKHLDFYLEQLEYQRVGWLGHS